MRQDAWLSLWPQRMTRLFQRQIILPGPSPVAEWAPPRRGWHGRLQLVLQVGVNPLLGSTTVACLAIAFLLRLNLVASQITNHLVYPLQLAMFFVFLDAGDKLFHTSQIPLGKEAMLAGMRHHPLATTRLLCGAGTVARAGRVDRPFPSSRRRCLCSLLTPALAAASGEDARGASLLTYLRSFVLLYGISGAQPGGCR